MAQKRQSAFNRALKEAQTTSAQPGEEQRIVEEVSPNPSPVAEGTVKQENREEGAPQHGVTSQRGFEKATFYARSDQLEKLDDLAYEYRKRTGKRINRNDIVRYLIDRCDLDFLFSEGEGLI